MTSRINPGGGDYHTMGVDGVAQNALNWANDHVLKFVKTDGVLMSSEVRWPREDVNHLNRGNNALFEVVDGEEVDINIVNDIMKCGIGKGRPMCQRLHC